MKIVISIVATISILISFSLAKEGHYSSVYDRIHSQIKEAVHSNPRENVYDGVDDVNKEIMDGVYGGDNSYQSNDEQDTKQSDEVGVDPYDEDTYEPSEDVGVDPYDDDTYKPSEDVGVDPYDPDIYN